jgi:predicted nucleic acid-binding protein
MNGKAFLDTNVLVYAATGREAHPPKFRRAREIVATAEVGISTQVIGEFVDNVQKAQQMPRPLTTDEVAEWVEWLFRFPLVEVDRHVVEVSADRATALPTAVLGLPNHRRCTTLGR